jgi:hypothetical protein
MPSLHTRITGANKNPTFVQKCENAGIASRRRVMVVQTGWGRERLGKLEMRVGGGVFEVAGGSVAVGDRRCGIAVTCE